MSWGVEADGFIFLSGVVAVDGEGNVVGPQDPERQAQACLDHIEALLQEAGVGLDAILRATCYATSAEAARAYVSARAARVKSRPAATTVLVSGLLKPGLLLEVEVIARSAGAA